MGYGDGRGRRLADDESQRPAHSAGSAVSPQLQNVPIVHLAFASAAGEPAAAPLLHALRDVPPPTVDSAWAPADAARLAEIHLDPPGPLPALGVGRWLGTAAPTLAHDLLTAGGDTGFAGGDDRVAQPRQLGARAGWGPNSRARALPAARGRRGGRPRDHGPRPSTDSPNWRRSRSPRTSDWLRPTSPRGGRRSPAGLPTRTLERLAQVRAAVDPHRRVAPSRLSAPSGGV